jgi:hypothetical protein
VIPGNPTSSATPSASPLYRCRHRPPGKARAMPTVAAMHVPARREQRRGDLLCWRRCSQVVSVSVTVHPPGWRNAGWHGGGVVAAWLRGSGRRRSPGLDRSPLGPIWVWAGRSGRPCPVSNGQRSGWCCRWPGRRRADYSVAMGASRARQAWPGQMGPFCSCSCPVGHRRWRWRLSPPA